MKKFISICWVYPEYVQNLQHDDNYVLQPFEVAKEKGYACELFLLEKENKLVAPEFIKVIQYKNIFQYIIYLIRNRNEIVYANTLVLRSLMVGIFCRNATFMPHYYAYPGTFLKKVCVKFFYTFFKYIRVFSLAEGQELVNKLHIAADKIWFCPLVVSNAYNFRVRNIQRPIKIIAASVWRPIKDPITILQAIKLLKDRGYNIKLYLAGRDDMKILTKEAKDLNFYIDEMNLQHEVELLGQYNHFDLPLILESGDIFIQSSLKEGQCLTVYEAALAGLPLCLSNIPSFSSAFQSSALFHDIGDYEKLADNIIKYIKKPELVKKFTILNEAYIVKQCSYEEISKKMHCHFK